MSSAPNWSQAEKELYALGTRVLLDDMKRQQIEWRESVALDGTSTGDPLRQHTEAMADAEARHQAALQAIRDDTRAFIRSMYDDDEATEPASNQDAAAARGGDKASLLGAPSSSSPAGHSSGQPQLNPYEAELERARLLAEMPLQEYAVRRAELGVRSPESLDRLFGA